MNQQALAPQTTLQGGRYTILRTLGQGGFGITYLAMQRGLEREVVVKEFFMKSFCDRVSGTQVTLGTAGSREEVSRFREKFLKEARNIAQLHHPNIVQVFDIFEENGTAYYVMEYACGGSLADKVAREGSLQESVATRYICQVANALAYLHQRNMSHLDVKPANIMLDSDDNALLIDFGLAKQYDGQSGEQTSSTPVGISEGYAAPEQYRMGGVGRFSPQTDVYALGATFYFLLTRERPPVAADVVEDGVPVDILHRAGVSQKAIYTIEQAMKGRRKDRMKSVEDLLETLDGKVEALVGDTEILNETQPLSQIDSGKNPNQVITPPQWHSGKTKVEVLSKRPKSRKERLLEAFGFKNSSSFEKTTVTVSTISNGGLTFNVYGISFDMIPVEGGTFKMGPPYDNEENPTHEVTLNSYYIGKTEVTQALWKAVMDYNPSYFKGPYRPVERVSWIDCQEFIAKLNQMTGKQFRLPTEAEWEYAARGGNKSQGYEYSGSNNENDVAWYSKNSCSQTVPVGIKRPNELGIYDMSGNVWEWCNDWYGSYCKTAQINPKGPSSGPYRVSRGGSWRFSYPNCCVYIRHGNYPGNRDYYHGLRLVLS